MAILPRVRLGPTRHKHLSCRCHPPPDKPAECRARTWNQTRRMNLPVYRAQLLANATVKIVQDLQCVRPALRNQTPLAGRRAAAGHGRRRRRRPAPACAGGECSRCALVPRSGRAMQSQDRAQVFGVVCRQVGSSVQVLLQKVGRGPPTDRRWAFVGGPVQPSDDTGVRLSDTVSMQLFTIVPPSEWCARSLHAPPHLADAALTASRINTTQLYFASSTEPATTVLLVHLRQAPHCVFSSDVPPNFQLQSFAITTNPSKPITYHVVTVPTGNDSWPSARDAHDR